MPEPVRHLEHLRCAGAIDISARGEYFLPPGLPGKPRVRVIVKAVLVASEDLSEDFVYELLTQMFENQESMAATQAKFQFLTLENAVAGVGDVPMHPGAEKFYTEKGVL